MKYDLQTVHFRIIRVIALLLVGLLALTSCSEDDDYQIPWEQTGVPRIILDVDICSSTDDLFAMVMHLYNGRQLRQGVRFGIQLRSGGWVYPVILPPMARRRRHDVLARRSWAPGALSTRAGHLRHFMDRSSSYKAFIPSPSGNCRYQLPGDNAWAAAKLDYIRQMNKMHWADRSEVK